MLSHRMKKANLYWIVLYFKILADQDKVADSELYKKGI